MERSEKIIEGVGLNVISCCRRDSCASLVCVKHFSSLMSYICVIMYNNHTSVYSLHLLSPRQSQLVYQDEKV